MAGRSERNMTIDILRVIGLMLVIAAHCDFPDLFIEIREFDVVLLAAVSGMSFYLTSAGKDFDYASYVKKRFLRLVLPVWGFLVFFFLFFRLLGRTFSTGEIISSFLLLSGGILFIWVYRIFFVNALLNQFLKNIAERFSMTGSAFLLSGGILLNELLYRMVSMRLAGGAGKLFDYIVIYTLGYAMISFAGMLWIKANQKARMILTAGAAAFFSGAAVIGGLRGFYAFKYPPQLCYIAYGLLCTFVLYLLFSAVSLNEKAGQLITWLSVNTMRIYMWHIFLYYLLDTLFPAFMGSAWLSYAVLFGGGVIGASAQGRLMKLAGR